MQFLNGKTQANASVETKSIGQYFQFADCQDKNSIAFITQIWIVLTENNIDLYFT